MITDRIDLVSLLKSLKEKQTRYNEDRYKCLFDLDHEKNTLDDLNALMVFENSEFESSDTRHTHSGDRLDILGNGKTWLGAKASWKKKIKELSENQ